MTDEKQKDRNEHPTDEAERTRENDTRNSPPGSRDDAPGRALGDQTTRNDSGDEPTRPPPEVTQHRDETTQHSNSTEARSNRSRFGAQSGKIDRATEDDDTVGTTKPTQSHDPKKQ